MHSIFHLFLFWGHSWRAWWTEDQKLLTATRQAFYLRALTLSPFIHMWRQGASHMPYEASALLLTYIPSLWVIFKIPKISSLAFAFLKFSWSQSDLQQSYISGRYYYLMWNVLNFNSLIVIICCMKWNIWPLKRHLEGSQTMLRRQGGHLRLTGPSRLAGSMLKPGDMALLRPVRMGATRSPHQCLEYRHF